jgi:PAS domain-containing protein
MRGAQNLKRKTPTPGMRALDSCGDGFWEFDLVGGSAWFSEWFFRKLAWHDRTRHTTLNDLQTVMSPAAWDALMRKFRDHLEEGLPLDLEIDVQLPDDARERWRIRGAAHRNELGQPIYLAGSMCDVSQGAPDGSGLSRLRGAFDALPVAAALLDARVAVLEANRLWREFPAGTAEQAIGRLRAANSQTAIEFWLDQGEGFTAGARQLRVRAIAFQHQGSRHLVVTLEDRRSD